MTWGQKGRGQARAGRSGTGPGPGSAVVAEQAGAAGGAVAVHAGGEAGEAGATRGAWVRVLTAEQHQAIGSTDEHHGEDEYQAHGAPESSSTGGRLPSPSEKVQPPIERQKVALCRRERCSLSDEQRRN